MGRASSNRMGKQGTWLAAVALSMAGAGAPAAGPGMLAGGATAGGGWAVFPAPSDHLPAADSARMHAQIRVNIARLESEGRLAAPRKVAAPSFLWPVRIADGIPGRTTHGISNFIDHDPAANSISDFACGKRTYDLGGAGHRGTDIFPLFGWKKQDNDEAMVVAAASGTIVLKQDGNQDRTCGSLSAALPGAAQWNAVSLRHADGSVTWYGHLKQNSLTPKAVGDTVDEGEFLGVVGSSGFSSGPHMHFEVYDAAGNLIDPWEGSCNPSTATSWWRNQPPYFDPQIVMVMPSKADPGLGNFAPPCDAATHVAATVPASYYYQADYYFAPGDTAFFTAFLRDVQPGATIAFTLRQPGGTVLNIGTDISTQPYFAGGFFYRALKLPANAATGQWNMEVAYAGHTQTAPIFVGPAGLRPAAATVFDFRNAGLDHYFRTANAGEAGGIDAGAAGPGWQRTGDDFLAFSGAATGSGAAGVCRFYGSVAPGPNSHFYTAEPAECDGLKLLQDATPPTQPRWNFEEIAFSVLLPVDGVCPPQAPVPVYRLYNNGFARNDSNHRYTTRISVYHQQSALGWSREGPVMCANGRP